MRKRLFALMLAAAMVAASLAGCGGSSSSTESTTAAAAETEAAAEEEETEAAEAEAAEEAPEGSFVGEGEGRNGAVKVALTFDADGTITSAEVIEHEETPDVGTLAIDELIPLIVSGNTINLDAVTGATITSEAIIAAATQAIEAAGFDPADYQGDVAAEKGEDLSYDVDVAIIGAGGAGMAAAASAAEEGASVVVLEKMSAIGGNTKLAEGTYNSADPGRQSGLTMNDSNRAEVEADISAETDDPEYQALMDDVRADYEKWQEEDGVTLFDSTNWHALQTYLGGGNIDNIPIIRRMADEAPATLEWLEDTIGVPFKTDYIFMAIGGKWARGHQVDLVAATGEEGDNGGRVYISKLEEYSLERGVEIVTDARATALVLDEEGNVTGVEAERSDGSKVSVTAKSVVITTGGYGRNSEMVLKYSDGAITTTLASCAVSSTGDGMILAEEIGGSLKNTDQIQVHPLGDPLNDCGCVAEFVGNWLSATEYMFVNKEGERFINEDNTRYAISMAELQQTDGQMWLIVDSSEIEGDDTRTEQIEKLMADGHSYKGETLEELAEAIGVDPEALQASVDKYNAGMLAGEDEFGKAADENSVIEQGPFYASLRTPTVHYTMGGIEVDVETQVVDTEGNVIPNLYAAGEVATGVHGNNRLGGNAFPDIMVYGRIAGINAAANAAE